MQISKLVLHFQRSPLDLSQDQIEEYLFYLRQHETPSVKSSVTYRAKTRSFLFLLHKKKTHVATAMLTFFLFYKNLKITSPYPTSYT
jgi:hypothetical protein